MNTKTFELTIEERDAIANALWFAIDEHLVCTKREWDQLVDLRERLMPKKVQKSGWVLKNTLVAVWQKRPLGEKDQFQHITWEEVE